MIRIITDTTFGYRKGKTIEPKTKDSEPFELTKKREKELVEMGIAEYVEEQEEKRNELKLYHLYKKYVDSGLLDGAIKDFYIGRLFNIFDNLELSEKEKEYELLYLYKKSNEKVKYEKLIKE